MNALAKGRSQLIERRAAGAGQGDGCPTGMERAGDGTTEAASGAGNESLAASQIEHEGSPLSLQGSFEGCDVLRRADGGGRGARCNTFHESGQDLTRPDLIK